MAKDLMFKTVRFNGFDQEEVLTFLDEIVTKHKEDEARYTEQIEELQNQLNKVTDKNMELRVKNKQLIQILQSQDHASTIQSTQEVCDRMLEEARVEAEKILKNARDRANKVMVRDPISFVQYNNYLLKELDNVAQAHETIADHIRKLEEEMSKIQVKGKKNG